MNKYVVIDYFSVFQVDDFGYEVNDVCTTDFIIEVSDTDSDADIVEKLINVGYLAEGTCATDVVFDWLDENYCEISEEDSMYPIGRLQLAIE